MIGGIILLIGILLVWVGATDRGQKMWAAVFGGAFKPLGFGGQLNGAWSDSDHTQSNGAIDNDAFQRTESVAIYVESK